MDIKKILQVLDSNNEPVKINESTDHTTRMVIDHYQTPVTEKQLNSNNSSAFAKYYKLAEADINARDVINKTNNNSYAKIIAERVLMKENPDVIPDKIDTITVDVPLLIRLLEYAKEDAKTDMDLHFVTEKLIELSKNQKVLTMQNYDAIIGTQKALPGIK